MIVETLSKNGDLYSKGKLIVNNPEIIVVHAMGEYIFGRHSTEYLDEVDGTSAHLHVDPYGTAWRQRWDHQTAFHAKDFNVNSLGIEVLVPGEHNYASFKGAIKGPWVKEIQYLVTLRLISEWLVRYPIQQVVRHSDIDPARKVDPGAGFPWKRLLTDIEPIITAKAEGRINADDRRH